MDSKKTDPAGKARESDVVSGLPSTVRMPDFDAPTLLRVEPATRFVSADELFSRGEELNRRDPGSGKFERVTHSPGVPAVERARPVRDPVPPAKLRSAASGPSDASVRRRRIIAIALASALSFSGGLLLGARTPGNGPPAGPAVARPPRAANSLPPAPGAASGRSDAANRVATSTLEKTGPGAAAGAPSSSMPASATPPESALRRETPGVHGATLQRAAVDAVVEGRYDAALGLYRRLAGDDPSRQAYRDAVNVLAARLAEARGRPPP